MGKLTKLERSQKAHFRLWDKYRDLLDNSPLNSPQEQKYSILHHYHWSVYFNQKKSNRLMNKEEKKKTYSRTVKKFDNIFAKYRK